MASDLQEKLRAHCGAPEHWGKVDIKVGQVRECWCDEYREAAALALEDAARLVDRFCTEHKIISNLGGELAPHPGGPQDVDLRAVGKELGIQLRARIKELRS